MPMCAAQGHSGSAAAGRGHAAGRSAGVRERESRIREGIHGRGESTGQKRLQQNQKHECTSAAQHSVGQLSWQPAAAELPCRAVCRPHARPAARRTLARATPPRERWAATLLRRHWATTTLTTSSSEQERAEGWGSLVGREATRSPAAAARRHYSLGCVLDTSSFPPAWRAVPPLPTMPPLPACPPACLPACLPAGPPRAWAS